MSINTEKITVVIPAYNEEKLIAEIIDRVRPFCDDVIVSLAKNSSDRTGEIARSKGVRIIKDRGQGKGDGMRCAINFIPEGIIVFIDADGSHIPEDIPKLTGPIQNEDFDMVIASRFLGGSEELHGDFNKFLRMFFSIVIAQIINWRFRESIMDTQNGFRAIKVGAAKKLRLKSKHTEVETEMDMKCFKKGFTIKEVPSMELARRYGESNLGLARHGPKYAWTVFKNLF